MLDDVRRQDEIVLAAALNDLVHWQRVGDVIDMADLAHIGDILVFCAQIFGRCVIDCLDIPAIRPGQGWIVRRPNFKTEHGPVDSLRE
jgi:hypothetical protein